MTIYLENISKQFKDKVVLNQITATFASGQIIGLIGPNGVGKTTLMRIMVNLDTSYNGTVTFGTVSNHNEKVFEQVSFLQDNRVLYPQLSAYDHLMLLAAVHKLPQSHVIDIAEKLQLTSYLHKRVQTYSLGMKQNLLLAMAFLPPVKYIIMDEPLNGLDPSKVIEFKQFIRQNKAQGITQIISSHNLSLIQDIADEAYFLKNGQLDKIDMAEFNQEQYLLSVNSLQQATATLTAQHLPFEIVDNQLMVRGNLAPYIAALTQQNITIDSCQIAQQSLEEQFKLMYH